LLIERVSSDDKIVISDVRDSIEMAVVRDAGGEVWFVDRPGVGPVGITGHSTETALDGATFDRTIHNNGTLTNLRDLVDLIFSSSSLDILIPHGNVE
jgi:hypothetical protein